MTPKLPPHRVKRPYTRRTTPKDHGVAGDGTVMVRLHIYLPKEACEWLDLECDKRKVNRSALILKCISEALFR